MKKTVRSLRPVTLERVVSDVAKLYEYQQDRSRSLTKKEVRSVLGATEVAFDLAKYLSLVTWCSLSPEIALTSLGEHFASHAISRNLVEVRGILFWQLIHSEKTDPFAQFTLMLYDKREIAGPVVREVLSLGIPSFRMLVRWGKFLSILSLDSTPEKFIYSPRAVISEREFILSLRENYKQILADFQYPAVPIHEMRRLVSRQLLVDSNLFDPMLICLSNARRDLIDLEKGSSAHLPRGIGAYHFIKVKEGIYECSS